MRILIQQTATLLYLRMLDEWTAHQKEAFDFQSFERAVNFICETKLVSVQVVLTFPETGWRRAIPFPLLAPGLDKMSHLSESPEESAPERSKRMGSNHGC